MTMGWLQLYLDYRMDYNHIVLLKLLPMVSEPSLLLKHVACCSVPASRVTTERNVGVCVCVVCVCVCGGGGGVDTLAVYVPTVYDRNNSFITQISRIMNATANLKNCVTMPGNWVHCHLEAQVESFRFHSSTPQHNYFEKVPTKSPKKLPVWAKMWIPPPSPTPDPHPRFHLIVMDT